MYTRASKRQWLVVMGKRIPRKQWVAMSVQQQQAVIKSRQQAQTGGVSIKKNKKIKASKRPKQLRSAGVPTGTALLPTDVRVATSAKTNVSLANQVRTITVGKTISGPTFATFAMGYISRALERGYQASASNNWNPYYAVVYLTGLLLSYANAKPVPTTQMPLWLLQICHAISPKGVPFESAKVNYQFVGPATDVPTVNTVWGYLPYGYQYSLGTPSGGTVNGFPIITATGSAYDDTLGAAAFQEVSKFMETSALTVVEKRISKIVPSSTTTPFTNDVSAFALYKLAEGVGATGQGGGIYGQLQHEVPILHPILSLISCGADSFILQDPSRNFNWSTPVTGDPTCLAALASTLLSTRQLSMKRNLRVKAIDFMEFAETLGDWVQQIIQAYFNDEANQLTAAASINALCPLTLQEVLLLLRAVMMAAFKESQAAVQGLYPFTPSSSTDNQFVPFVSSVGTCPLLALDMQLPSMFVENIRALTARMVNHGGTAQNVQWYLPCLGQRALDNLNHADFPVTYLDSTGASTTYSAFASGVLYEKEVKTAKGDTSKQSLVEAPISMIDGSSTTNLLYINDPKRLKELVVIWNEWLSTSGVGSFSMKLCTFGTEPGINVLASIGLTRIWTTVGGGERGHSRGREEKMVKYEELVRKADKIIDIRIQKKYKHLVSGPYANRSAIIDVAQGELLSAPYEQVLGTWILPTDDDELILGENSTVIQRFQFMYGEGYSMARVSAAVGTALAALHSTYASKMVKAKLAEQSDISAFIDECANLGRGGILSGLVAGLVGSAFPSLKGVATTISEALPI